MNNRMLFAAMILLTGSLALTVSAQQPAATPPPEDDPEVVKISTNLIQMDVVVTDKKGNHVTDLGPADFEIYENGKKQRITNFSYVVTNAPANADPNPPPVAAGPGVPVPPVRLRPEQVRRTYALVVDDLGLSFTSVFYVREALKKFIDEQMAPGDLVAILRTGAGLGALQSFTSDKRQLHAAIEKIRWNSYGRSGISPFEPIGTTLKEDIQGSVDSQGRVKNVAGLEEEKEFAEQIEKYRQDNFSYGTLGALRYIIRGLRDLPGRKSVILFSEGFQSLETVNGFKRVTGIFDSLRKLTDYANRSSVVFYTLDPRGLQNPDAGQADDQIRQVLPGGFDPGRRMVSGSRESRAEAFRDSQMTLRYLAYQTGGLPYVNRNNLTTGLREVVADQAGYYLIAYEPDEKTFDPSRNRYNDLEIKVLRKGTKVRYRSGFFGIPSERLTAARPQTAGQQIYDALVSPFAAGDISMNLTAMFAEDASNGLFIRSLVFIEGRDLKFTDEPDGTKKADFDIIAMTFGDNGQPVDETSKNYTVRVSGSNYQKLLETGIVYNLAVPVKKPGAYQFRVALRDSASARVGSASQYIEIPDLKKDRLVLSDLVLNGYSAVEWQKIQAGERDVDGGGVGADVDTALKRFKPGTVLQYGYMIYNAETKKGRQAPQLEIRVRLLRDRKIILEGDPEPFVPDAAADPRRLTAAGALTLGRGLPPGNYVLQVVVTDKLAKQKHATTTRWVEFEIEGEQ